MTQQEISNSRMISQKISSADFTSAEQIVTWMGAIQAQDYSMVKWAIGVRTLNSTDKTIEEAVNKGDIIRIHIMRPTWHFVSARDIYWLLELTAPRIRSSLNFRHKQLELSDLIIRKSNRIIEKQLSERSFLTRDEISESFNDADIKTDNNRLSHLLVLAELNGIICSGPVKGNKQTYALLPERVPHKKVLTKEESLAELARRYFTSRCPATLQDFVWWSGLTFRDARDGLDSVKSDFISETEGTQQYWLTDSYIETRYDKPSAHLLPAFDEFLISYKDRSASISITENKKAISDNGIFRPVIVTDGQVAGLWKRTIKKDKVLVEAELFIPLNKTVRGLIENKAFIFGQFLNKEVVVSYKSKPTSVK